MSADGKSVILFAVNDRAEPIERPLDFSAFGSEGQAIEVWTLADTRQAGEPDAPTPSPIPTASSLSARPSRRHRPASAIISRDSP